MSTRPSDRSTVEAILQRSLTSHQSLEQLVREKQNTLARLHEQVAQVSAETERLRGALEYSNLTIGTLRDDLKRLDQIEAAGKLAADRAAASAIPEAVQ